MSFCLSVYLLVNSSIFFLFPNCNETSMGKLAVLLNIIYQSPILCPTSFKIHFLFFFFEWMSQPISHFYSLSNYMCRGFCFRTRFSAPVIQLIYIPRLTFHIEEYNMDLSFVGLWFNSWSIWLCACIVILLQYPISLMNSHLFRYKGLRWDTEIISTKVGIKNAVYL